MIAEKGIARGVLEDICGEKAVCSGEAVSAMEGDDSRSETAETGPEGDFEDSNCEDVYILGRKNQSALQADIQRGSRYTFAQRMAIRNCRVRLESLCSLP